MKRSVFARAARISAVLAAGSAGIGTAAALTVTGAAHADPTFLQAKVGVGSDTIQDLVDAYAGAEPFTGPNEKFYTPLFDSTNNAVVASYDAIPFGGSPAAPGCITTRLGGPSMDRPNGSSNGVQAVRASSGSGSNAAGATFWQASTASCTGSAVNVSGYIDFARSSRGPNTAGTNLTFIPFARDGITYALLQATGDTNPLGALTTTQLDSIYNSGTAGGATIGTDRVGGCLPQSGSGTRSFWEGAINVTDANADAEATAAGCNGTATGNIEENNANSFYAYASAHVVAPTSTTNGVAFIIPFSAGSWIAQANGVSTDNSATGRSGGVVLGDPNSIGGGATTGTAPNLAPNSTYYQDANFGRDLFIVVPTTKISGLSRDKGLTALFAGSTAQICTTGAQNTAHSFGFDSLNSSDATKTAGGTTVFLLCGDTTDTANN
jgi:hypothetical protein